MKTTDLWFAGFLRLKGYSPYKVVPLFKKKYEFYFDITQEEINKLNVEYQNSVHIEMKYAQERLKDFANNVKSND